MPYIAVCTSGLEGPDGTRRIGYTYHVLFGLGLMEPRVLPALRTVVVVLGWCVVSGRKYSVRRIANLLPREW